MQARSVVEGCNADVVTLALAHDISLIEDTGLINEAGWISSRMNPHHILQPLSFWYEREMREISKTGMI